MIDRITSWLDAKECLLRDRQKSEIKKSIADLANVPLDRWYFISCNCGPDCPIELRDRARLGAILKLKYAYEEMSTYQDSELYYCFVDKKDLTTIRSLIGGEDWSEELEAELVKGGAGDRFLPDGVKEFASKKEGA